MPAKIISMMNMKGGVGKTTLTVALAEGLAVMAKKRVLVIDLDAQASCTFALLGRLRMFQVIQKGNHSGRLFRHLLDQIKAVKTTQDFEPLTATAAPIGQQAGPGPPNMQALIEKEASSLKNEHEMTLDLIAAHQTLQKTEREILFELGRKSRLQENPEQRVSNFFEGAIQSVMYSYDFIIVDCPPGISSFSASAVRTSELILTPVMAESLSEMGLSVFARDVLRSYRRKGQLPRPARVIFNRIQSDAALSEYQRLIEELVSRYDDVLTLADTVVLQDQALADVSGERGTDSNIREKYDRSINIIEDLVKEVLQVTGASNVGT